MVRAQSIIRKILSYRKINTSRLQERGKRMATMLQTVHKNHICVASAALLTGLLAHSAEAQTVQSNVGLVEEVVVTAQKRSERLLDVPLAVTSVAPDSVVSTGGGKLADYFRTVPSLAIQQTDGSGMVNIAIRGIVTGTQGVPTVGVLVDDVPTGASTNLAGGGLRTADIDPGDLQRIEVLRGPQGTLYGASSMGGLVKYVTVDPSTTDSFGRVSATVSDTHEGTVGYGVRGSVNIPLADQKVGLRLSGSLRHEGGYVDDPAHGLSDVNEEDAYSLRGSLLANLGEAKVKISGVYQQNEADGSSIIDVDYLTRPLFGDLIHSQVPGTGKSAAKVTFASANINVPLPGGFTLDSITGYGVNDHDFTRDNSGFGGGAAFAFFGVRGAIYKPQAFRTEKLTQEFRIASDEDKRLSGLVGVFYTHEDSKAQFVAEAHDFDTGEYAGTYLVQEGKTDFDEYAAFGSLAWRITDRLDVQGGARYSKNEQHYSEVATGVSVVGGLRTASSVAKDNAVTYSIGPRFKITPDQMIYARLATGYRVGGPNVGVAIGVPASFAPDETVNYELGSKGMLFDRTLTYDIALFHIDWKDIQITETITVNNVVNAYVGNRGKAQSQGVEYAFNWRTPIEGLRISTTGLVGDTELKESLTQLGSGIYALKGEPLVNSPKFAGTFGIDQDFALASDRSLFFGAIASYTGERRGTFARGTPASGNVRQRFDDYTTLDVRLGARSQNWTLTAYVNNVTDDRGTIYSAFQTVPATAASSYYANIVRPRTFGVTFERSF